MSFVFKRQSYVVLSYIFTCLIYIYLPLFIRWGRASYGGFNKKLEELARRMNSKHDSDDENEEEDEFGVAERLKLIREGKYKTEYLSDSSDSEIESFEEKGKKRKNSQKGETTTKFMRPE